MVSFRGETQLYLKKKVMLVGIDDCQGRIPDVTLLCMQQLRQYHPAVKISVEVEKPGREGLQELAALADVVFYSKSWAQVRCLPYSVVIGTEWDIGKGIQII